MKFIIKVSLEWNLIEQSESKLKDKPTALALEEQLRNSINNLSINNSSIKCLWLVVDWWKSWWVLRHSLLAAGRIDFISFFHHSIQSICFPQPQHLSSIKKFKNFFNCGKGRPAGGVKSFVSFQLHQLSSSISLTFHWFANCFALFTSTFIPLYCYNTFWLLPSHS